MNKIWKGPKPSDEYQTPQWLFDELNKEFNFDVDLCATEDNSKCDDFCINYLDNHVKCISENYHFPLDWRHGPFRIAFMNPPYSNPYPFIEKAWEDSKYCKIVCLVRGFLSAKWWAIFWEYGNMKPEFLEDKGKTLPNFVVKQSIGPKPGCEVRFLPKKVKFEIPGKKTTSASFPCAILIFDRRLYD